MGRMSCFPSQDQLGMHRLREHPNESKGDPTLWEPLQIRYSTQGLIGPNQRGRNSGRRGHNDARGGGEEGELTYFRDDSELHYQPSCLQPPIERIPQ